MVAHAFNPGTWEAKAAEFYLSEFEASLVSIVCSGSAKVTY